MNVKLNNPAPEDSLSAFASFFDDPKPLEKIWRQPLKNEELLDSQRVVMRGVLIKKIKKTNNYKKHFVQFTSDFICSTKVI